MVLDTKVRGPHNNGELVPAPKTGPLHWPKTAFPVNWNGHPNEGILVFPLELELKLMTLPENKKAPPLGQRF